jgi:tetratricopeptide (TPR) repeat protein
VYSDSLHNERLTLFIENDSIAFRPLGISFLEDVASIYIRRNVDTISPINHKLAEEYYQKALSMCKGDDCFEAVTYFELANHYHPCYYNYAYRMISIFGTKANFEVARTQLTEGISNDPKNTNLLYQRSLFYFQLNDYLFALNDLNMCILFDNEVDSFYYRRSVILKTIGYYEEAIDDLTSAIALDSSNTTYYIDRAMIFLTVGEGEKACQDFKLAVSLGYRGWHYKMNECGLKYEEVVKPEIITIERKL